ncbi:hypothetical protein OG496_27580 [Streptomyces sp. NBC_00988]|uniref:hypothetical protein n=1 Tax=Streptomyces sp. NBC_00988 TaxID=2903704 RepID=UPI003864425C|nr:hypothetical protein OG496_27580 [Streptomyces sp. NBC_00988]
MQISSNEIAWRGGKVVLVLPLPGVKQTPPDSPQLQALYAKLEGARSGGAAVAPRLPAADYHQCPRGTSVRWYCFYQNRDWNENVAGRRLQWSDPHCDEVMDFEVYSFAGQTSSWVNTGFLEVTVWDDSVHRLWTEAPNSLSAYVGSSNNDQARFFEACA